MSSYVSELSESLARFSERCRQQRWFGALFHCNVAQDITQDIAADHAKIRATATEAQGFDLEALAEIEQASAKDSDGGSLITPKELRRIRPLIVKSASLDQRAVELSS